MIGPHIPVTVVGNVASDPSIREAKGSLVATFRVATSSSRFDKATGTRVDGPASFYQVSCWRNLGENVVATLRRGHPVVVSGWLVQRSVERDGRRTTYTDIEATAVGLDLSRCQAQLVAVRRGPSVHDLPTRPTVDVVPGLPGQVALADDAA